MRKKFSFAETEIRDAFKRFGNIVDIRHFKPQGYAFVFIFYLKYILNFILKVKFDTQIAAGKAIAEMNNGEFLGQTIRMNWGKVEVCFFVSFFNLKK